MWTNILILIVGIVFSIYSLIIIAYTYNKNTLLSIIPYFGFVLGALIIYASFLPNYYILKDGNYIDKKKLCNGITLNNDKTCYVDGNEYVGGYVYVVNWKESFKTKYLIITGTKEIKENKEISNTLDKIKEIKWIHFHLL